MHIRSITWFILNNKLYVADKKVFYFTLPGAYIVTQPFKCLSPTMTAMAPLSCMAVTFCKNEHWPLSISAIQFSTLFGGWIILQPN